MSIPLPSPLCPQPLQTVTRSNGWDQMHRYLSPNKLQMWKGSTDMHPWQQSSHSRSTVSDLVQSLTAISCTLSSKTLSCYNSYFLMQKLSLNTWSFRSGSFSLAFFLQSAVIPWMLPDLGQVSKRTWGMQVLEAGLRDCSMCNALSHMLCCATSLFHLN